MTDIIERLESRVHDSYIDSEWLMDDALTELKSLRQQLAECQARETVLRNHFKKCKCQPMLYLPSNSNALDTLLKQEKVDFAERLGAEFGKTDAEFIRRMAEELE